MKSHICIVDGKRVARENHKFSCSYCNNGDESFDTDLSIAEIEQFNSICSKLENKANFPIKTNDGKEYWISRSTAVNTMLIFILNGVKHVLVGQRGKAMMDKPGFWNLICGYLDWNEDGPSAVKRELFEETSLILDELTSKYEIIKDDTKQPWYVDTNTGSNRQNITLNYAIVLKGKELPVINFNIIDSREVSDIRWIKMNDLHNYEFAFGHDIRINQYNNKIDEKDDLADFTSKNFSYLIERLTKLELNSASEDIIKKSLEQFERVSTQLSIDMWKILDMTTDRYKVEKYKKLLNKL